MPVALSRSSSAVRGAVEYAGSQASLKSIGIVAMFRWVSTLFGGSAQRTLGRRLTHQSWRRILAP